MKISTRGLSVVLNKQTTINMVSISFKDCFDNIIFEDFQQYDLIDADDDDVVIFNYDNEVSKTDNNKNIQKESRNLFDVIVNDFVLYDDKYLDYFNMIFKIGDMTVRCNELTVDDIAHQGMKYVDIEIDMKSKIDDTKKFIISIDYYYNDGDDFALKLGELGCGDELDYESNEE